MMLLLKGKLFKSGFILFFENEKKY